MSDESLASYGNRIAKDPTSARRRLKRDAASWIGVGLVHLAVILVLLISEKQMESLHHGGGPVETMFLLSMLQNPNAPPVRTIRPEVPSATAPQFVTAPITLPPPPPPIPQNPNAPASAGDIMKEVGQTLACGASSFEELDANQRAHCRHVPWQAHIAPNGAIVMDAAPKPLGPQEPLHLSGADEARHEMQTAPACPMMVNTPCLGNIFNDNRPYH